ncbi:hypothetical protein [Streptosporangium roseum]|uniref:hypothetical protein n=1 Tax=Streptosporangium roseum TaxID=2001 RepID=UPI0033275F71
MWLLSREKMMIFAALERPPTGDETVAEDLDAATLARRLDDMEVQAVRDFAQLNSTLDETLRRLEGREVG